MDRNELLATTRAEFMHGFLAAADTILPRCAHNLFTETDASYILTEQRQLLRARGGTQSRC